jgi:hypothetical protein
LASRFALFPRVAAVAAVLGNHRPKGPRIFVVVVLRWLSTAVDNDDAPGILRGALRTR